MGMVIMASGKLPNGIMCIWKDKSDDNSLYYSDSRGQMIVKSWVIPAIFNVLQKKMFDLLSEFSQYNQKKDHMLTHLF